MLYKVEISSTQYFPNGEFLNFSEEKYFWENEDNPLSDRKDAFDYLLSLSPKPNITFSVVLSFCDDSCEEEQLCSLNLLPLDDYDSEELANHDFDLRIEVENLHKERESYEAEGYYLGGRPIVLNDWEVLEYNDDLDEEIEVPAKILAVNRRLIEVINS